MRLLIAVILLTVAASTAHANDAAVEVSAGGLKLRKERSVLMEKERLHGGGQGDAPVIL